MKSCTVIAVLALVAVSFVPVAPAQEQGARPKVGKGKRDESGFLVHSIESELQGGPTEIRVLLPDRMETNQRYPVIYVCPVEAGRESKYGDGLLEVKKLDLHNKHGVIFVQPTFFDLPWYADHPTNPKIRQETYFLNVVLPVVEGRYSVQAEAKGRLLLGFSKSGWGAFSLLLRHPDVFGRAAAFDAPLTMDKPMFGMRNVVGTPENFEKYRVTALLELRAKELGPKPRLGLIGWANFGEHHRAIHDRMKHLKIRHDYRDEQKPKHTWDAGWLADAVRFLVSAER